MKSVADLHVRVIDKGLFLPIARRLAKEVAKVTFWTPWDKAFPTVKDMIGDGFDDVERVNSEWEDKNTVDLWVFADVGFSDMQKELISQGKIVWGARDADALELLRGKFLKSLIPTNLPQPSYEAVVGMEALRKHLRDKEQKWIKISKFRGDWETLHFRDWRQDEAELDARAVRLGPWKEVITYYVFDEIKTDIEDGCDTWCIDGQFPSVVIHGMEAKDKAYLGTFQKYADLPKEVRVVSDEYGPILGGYGYRSFFSTEVRITEDGRSYFIDPTLRAGSPPSQVMTEMIGNYADIIWRGAQGEVVDPEPANKFGVQALLSLPKGRSTWNTIEFPDELDQWVKCGNCMKIAGRLCFPPDPEEPGGPIGWLIGVGDSPQAAIEHLKRNVEELPQGVCCEFSHIADLIKEVDEAESKGMEFTEQVMPEPEIVLKESGS